MVDFVTQPIDCYPGKCYPEAGEKSELGCPLQGKQDEKGEDEILRSMANLVRYDTAPWSR